MPAQHSRILAFTVAALALILAWDASGGDLWLARQMGRTSGFALRENFWLTAVLHEGGRAVAWLLWLALLLALRWPPRFMRGLDLAARWQLVLAVLAAVLAINLLKYTSRSSCPWSLREFGGAATYVSHWIWGQGDGGPGHCFPAGHASAGFAFMTGWFVWRRVSPAMARAWLALALAAGLVLGIGQQLRGAHFMSHTLWTAWICWVVGWMMDTVFGMVRARQSAARAQRRL